MAKRGLTEKVRQGLWQGHYGTREHSLDQPGDPVTVTQLVLSIEQILEYQDNPRRLENPRYEEIKQSIAAQRGLNNSLDVTRRPGDEHYTICAGGNTRLRILRELFAETGDEAFARVHCLYHPWQGETTVLTSHLVENELRGELALIDKALALEHLRGHLEAESGEKLSRNAFIARLHGLGYTISKRHLLRYEFAAQHLLAAIPEALNSLGAKTLDHIRKIYAAAQEVWSHYQRDAEDFDILWEQALAHTDAPDWDPEEGRDELVARMAEALGIDQRAVRYELDTVLSGHPLPGRIDRMEDQSTSVLDADHDDAPEGMVRSGAMESENTAPDDKTAAACTPVAAEDEGDLEESAPFEPEPALNSPEPEFRPETTSDDEVVEGESVPDLREHIYRLAHSIARRYELDRCVHSWDHGVGYLVELPEAPDAGSQHPARKWIWWTLLAFSEALATDARRAHLPGHYDLPQIVNSSPGTVRSRMGSPGYVQIAMDFWSNPSVPETDIQDFIQLLRLCRQLRNAALERNMNLWEGEP
ncbi:ParB family protein [Halorhodospira halophila]|uniref:ParB family protein n=1 Tax=Halorhodospira halophila TaxID=1053 RepID=UPI001914BC98|nr:ParB family protein [Halorhodospira halophila]MBK5942956.1 hypothetical protein [Halorhodospira halophila]